MSVVVFSLFIVCWRELMHIIRPYAEQTIFKIQGYEKCAETFVHHFGKTETFSDKYKKTVI